MASGKKNKHTNSTTSQHGAKTDTTDAHESARSPVSLTTVALGVLLVSACINVWLHVTDQSVSSLVSKFMGIRPLTPEQIAAGEQRRKEGRLKGFREKEKFPHDYKKHVLNADAPKEQPPKENTPKKKSLKADPVQAGTETYTYIAPTNTLLERLQRQNDVLIGREEYLKSEFVTAGNRAYLIGHQDGSFPPMGWHIAGEMGGLWTHPIKLLDGFDATLNYKLSTADGDIKGISKLTNAHRFTNYPVGNTHTFSTNEGVQKKDGLTIERSQFVPDPVRGVIIEFVMTNELPENKKNEDAATTGKIENGIGVYTIDFDFKPIPDLRPTWLGERTKMVDGKDEIYRTNYIKDDRDGGKKGTKRELWAYQDSESEWTVMAEQLETVGSQAYVNWNPHRPDGLRTKIILHPGESACVRYIMAGGINAQQAYDELWRGRREWEQLYDQKAELYDKAARASDLTMSAEGSDKNTAWVETFATMFRWLKYNSLWLGVDVEGWEGVTLSAGLADYPWLFGCDSEYAILGLNALGLFELSDNTLKTLHVTSEKANSNGRVVHEVSTNGAVYHHGNLNETPQFVTAVWNTFLWTGDITKLEFHFEFMKKGMAWLVSPENDPDGDGIPNGTGMIEIANMDNEMIDVAVYTARAWEQLAMITRTIKASEELAVDYDKRASKLRAQIAEHYWIKSEKAFADVRGTPTQARVLVLQAIERAKKLSKPWAVAELELTLRNIDSTIAEQSDLGNDASKQGFVTHHNWIVNTPMEVGYGDCVMGRAALDKARNYTNPFGLFVTGIDRDETAGNDWEGVASTKSSFSYEGAVMTLGTGVVAVGESVYGRPQKAMEYLEMLTRSFSFALPGSQYEVSPDFGMMTQAWNVYAGAYPVVCQFFGIEPLAHKYSVYFSHQMPKLLSATTLNGIRVGKAGVVPKGPKRKSADNSNSISVHYSKIAVGVRNGVQLERVHWTFAQSNADYVLYLKIDGSCVGDTNTECAAQTSVENMWIEEGGVIQNKVKRYQRNKCTYVALHGERMSVGYVQQS